MGTALVRFITTESDSMHWGVLRESSVYPLALATNSHRDVMALYFDRRDSFDGALSEIAIDINDVTLQAPLSADIQIICQGLNYAEHVEETGAKQQQQEELLFFAKASSSLSAPNDCIVRPVDCQLLDYEIELGLVLRHNLPIGTTVTDDNLADYVGGLVICNDVSARDLQFGSPGLQWFRSKSQPSFCPAGPVLYIMDPEDFAQLYSLDLTLKVNGELRQHALTSNMISKPPASLTQLASFMAMRAGDCLLTGTPGGVVFKMSRKTGWAIMTNLKNSIKRRDKVRRSQLEQNSYLQAGDKLELSIKSADGYVDLGTQRNTVVVVD